MVTNKPLVASLHWLGSPSMVDVSRIVDDSNRWVLHLFDGKRLFLLLKSPLRLPELSMLPFPFVNTRIDSKMRNEIVEVGSVSDDCKRWYDKQDGRIEDSADDSDNYCFNEDALTIPYGDLALEGLGEEEPIWVEPLRMTVSEMHTGVDVVGEKGYDRPNQQHSSWVLKKFKGLGKVLGVKYYGFKEAFLELFSAVESNLKDESLDPNLRRINDSSKAKGDRELKNLISNVNYKVGVSRIKTNNSGRTRLELCI